MIHKTKNPAETEMLASEFAKKLRRGDIVRLHGDIGAGKTAFVSGIAKELCPDAQTGSPTFSIMNIYDGELPLYHFDLYRISDADEIYDAGLSEYLGSAEAVSLVEWPDVADFEGICGTIYDVNINRLLDLGDEYREITINGGTYESACC